MEIIMKNSLLANSIYRNIITLANSIYRNTVTNVLLHFRLLCKNCPANFKHNTQWRIQDIP